MFRDNTKHSSNLLQTARVDLKTQRSDMRSGCAGLPTGRCFKFLGTSQTSQRQRFLCDKACQSLIYL